MVINGSQRFFDLNFTPLNLRIFVHKTSSLFHRNFTSQNITYYYFWASV